MSHNIGTAYSASHHSEAHLNPAFLTNSLSLKPSARPRPEGNTEDLTWHVYCSMLSQSCG